MERNHDTLIEQLRARAADPEKRVDEAGNALSAMVGAMSFDHLFGMLGDVGAALRGVVHNAGASNQTVAPSGGPLVEGFDPVGILKLANTSTTPDLPHPATGRDIEKAEAALGLRIPPLLARIYTEVADGGFGAGQGLFSASSGLADEYSCMCEAEDAGCGPSWPAHLLPIAHLGDGVLAVVDTSAAASPVLEVDMAGCDPQDDTWPIEQVAPSLEAWLWDWVLPDAQPND